MATSRVLLGLLAGAAAGAILGVLFAPEKGSETRRKIMKKRDDLSRDAKNKFEGWSETISGKLSDAKEDAKDLLDKGKSKAEELKRDSRTT